MITLKLVVFGIIALVTLIVLVTNLTKWAESFRQYNIQNIKKTTNSKFPVKPLEGWFGTFFSRVWVIFMSLVLLGGIYFVLFNV